MTEERVFRHVNTLGMARVRLNIRTRRPKQRNQPYRTIIERPEGHAETVRIPPDQLPAYLLLPRFEPPGLIVGRGPTEEIPIADWWGWCFDAEPDTMLKDLSQRMGNGRVGLGHLRLDELGRMLAKIAHSFAIWRIGQGTFVPLLPDVIRKKRDDISLYVGGSPECPAPEPVHVKLNIDWLSGSPFDVLVAGIWLFPLLGAPVYQVVVGLRPAQRGHE